MAEKSYWELLKDPRWQKKRLEILQRDEFKCQRCGDTTTELNVHHGYYAKGKMPWEYDSETLHTLCRPCHQHIGGTMDYIREFIAFLHPKELDGLCMFLANSLHEVDKVVLFSPAIECRFCKRKSLAECRFCSWLKRKAERPAGQVVADQSRSLT